MWRSFRQANGNGTTCYWLGQRRSKDGENNSACLFIVNNSIFKLIMRYFFSQINNKLMMNFEKIHFTIFKMSVKMQIWWSNPYEMWFLEGQLPKYFFHGICSSGGKQTIHEVSAAFIVKNYHPRTSLRMLEYMLQSREPSWKFPSTLQTILNLVLINLQGSWAKQLKTKQSVLISTV